MLPREERIPACLPVLMSLLSADDRLPHPLGLRTERPVVAVSRPCYSKAIAPDLGTWPKLIVNAAETPGVF